MASTTGSRQRRLHPAEIGIGNGGDDRKWPTDEVVLTSVATAQTTRYLLTLPETVLERDDLTDFLARVAPFGCPPPHSLIRAYSLPDSPFPSILLKEHEGAAEGVGDAYLRFLAGARQHWLGALQGTGPGLSPVLAWESGPARQFLARESAARDTGLGARGVADDYLGRGLLLLGDPTLAAAWPTMMSLGGVTKIRKITGREFPVWVDLPAHQPALLASPLLARMERLLDES